MQNLNPPCPSWCDRLHGRNIPGTRHTTTVLDRPNMVVTATATTLPNGTSPVDIQTYNPDGDPEPQLYVLGAAEAAVAAQLFTHYDTAGLDRLGRAFTAAIEAVAEAAAA